MELVHQIYHLTKNGGRIVDFNFYEVSKNTEKMRNCPNITVPKKLPYEINSCLVDLEITTENLSKL